MIIVLKHQYEYGSDDILDYIASVEFESQKQMADDLSMSLATLKRRIQKLKDNGPLIINRYC